MTVQRSVQPTPEPDQGSVSAAENAARELRLLQAVERGLLSGLGWMPYPSDVPQPQKVALSVDLGNLSSALELVRARRSVVESEALAHLASSASALPEGLVTPEERRAPDGCTCPAGTYNPGNVHEPYCGLSHPEGIVDRRTRTGGVSALSQRAAEMRKCKCGYVRGTSSWGEYVARGLCPGCGAKA